METLLIVDDDPAIRLLMKHALSDFQYTIIEAESGEQALELFQQHSPDLTLLDVTMGGMDGFECCKKIRKLSNGSYSAVVIVTALEEPADIERAFEVGATDFMTKPLKWSLFRHRVRYIIKANQTVRDLSSHKTKLSKAQAIAHLGYWEWDFESASLECSDELYQLIGMKPQQQPLTFASTLRLVHPDDRTLFKQKVRAAANAKKAYDIEYRIIRNNNEVINIHERGEISQEFGRPHINGTLHDITNRKQSEQEIAYYAYYDTLTKLPNRRLFLDQLESALATANRRHEKLALLFIDLDRFKQVNDSYGHAVGDKLLSQAAGRIKDCVRVSDIVAVGSDIDERNKVARLAGDEFTVLLCELNAVENVTIIAQRIVDAFTEPFNINEHHAYISVSIGIAFYPDDSVDEQQLLQRADVAMYHAKEQGRNNYQFFSESMHAYLKQRLEIEDDLRQALLAGDQFKLFYQPQISAASNELIGFEALIRWQHPRKGLLMPDAFIDIAESSGVIIEIGQWVLIEACRQAAQWQKHTGLNHRMAVNLSALQFSHKCLPTQVEKALAETNIDPALLELEITETAIVNDVSETIPLLFRLKKLGVTLAIDDFGTGYSSLNYLKNFPIDTLKIDKSFVDEIVNNDKDAAIAQTIVQMAQNLGLMTVAEGVENVEQQQALTKMGCDEFQGYLFSRPQTAELIEQQYFPQVSHKY